MTASLPALEFDSVSVTYKGETRPSVKTVTLSISAGERVALLGNNGSGKTTLLYAAAGLLSYTGTIRVGGVVLAPPTKEIIRSRLGFLFSNPEDQILLPRVLDDVAFSLSRRGTPAVDRDAEAISMLRRLDADGLAERSPHQLSQGERLRVALAGALIGRPPLLLLDEPSENLDPPGKRRLAEMLVETGLAMLIATHDLRFAKLCCDRFVVLSAGKILIDAASAEDLVPAWDY